MIHGLWTHQKKQVFSIYSASKQRLILQLSSPLLRKWNLHGSSYLTRARYRPDAGAMGLAADTVFASRIRSTEANSQTNSMDHFKLSSTYIKPINVNSTRRDGLTV